MPHMASRIGPCRRRYQGAFQGPRPGDNAECGIKPGQYCSGALFSRKWTAPRATLPFARLCFGAYFDRALRRCLLKLSRNFPSSAMWPKLCFNRYAKSDGTEATGMGNVNRRAQDAGVLASKASGESGTHNCESPAKTTSLAAPKLATDIANMSNVEHRAHDMRGMPSRDRPRLTTRIVCQCVPATSEGPPDTYPRAHKRLSNIREANARRGDYITLPHRWASCVVHQQAGKPHLAHTRDRARTSTSCPMQPFPMRGCRVWLSWHLPRAAACHAVSHRATRTQSIERRTEGGGPSPRRLGAGAPVQPKLAVTAAATTLGGGDLAAGS